MSKLPLNRYTHYSNWGDRFGYALAKPLIKPISAIPLITPNTVTIVSFLIYIFGCISLVLKYPYHMMVGALCIFMGYLGDVIDGQLARFTGNLSVLGDYLDKTVDVMKIFFISFFPAFAVYQQTGNVFYIAMGFVICFAFCYRYYLKLETIFSMMSRDKNYLELSARQRLIKVQEMDRFYKSKGNNFIERIVLFFKTNQTIVWLDETEFVIFFAVGAVVNRLDIVLWIFTVGQVGIALWRLFERGYQLNTNSKELFNPMRK